VLSVVLYLDDTLDDALGLSESGEELGDPL
jgi:hypothetical protein